MTRLVLVLGDQLTPDSAALRAADKARDVVVMAEVADEAGYVPHHPKKIAFLFAAMRKFARQLRDDGWEVRYSRLDDDETGKSICAELMRRAGEVGRRRSAGHEPGEMAADRGVAGLSGQAADARGRTQVPGSHARVRALGRGSQDVADGVISYREMRLKDTGC